MLLRTGGQGHPAPLHTSPNTPFNTNTLKKLLKRFSHFSTRAYRWTDGLTDGLMDRQMDGLGRISTSFSCPPLPPSPAPLPPIPFPPSCFVMIVLNFDVICLKLNSFLIY